MAEPRECPRGSASIARRLRRIYRIFLRGAVHDSDCDIESGESAREHGPFLARDHPYACLRFCTCWIGDVRRVWRGQRPQGPG